MDHVQSAGFPDETLAILCPFGPSATGLVVRATNELRKHPAYTELQLSVSPAQLASIKRFGESALEDPLTITRQGVIIDGYARKEYADSVGISVRCVTVRRDRNHDSQFALFAAVITEVASPYAQECPGARRTRAG
jgi:hypothetical protein